MDQYRFRQALRTGCVDPYFACLLHKDSPAPPPAPDYIGAAKETGAQSIEAAKAGAVVNNPNVVSPYGNQNVTFDPATGQPSVTQTLNPQSQQIFDAQQGTRLGLANLGGQALGTAQSVMGTPFSYGGPAVQTSLPGGGPINQGPSASQYGQAQGGVAAPNLQMGLDTSGIARMPVNAGTTGQDAIMSRLQPQIQRENAASDAQLANQGIMRGSEAYDTSKTLLGQQHNDLLNQAALSGIGLDLSANQQGYNQALQSGQFGNTSQLAGFGAGLSNQQAGNAAIGQNFGMGGQAAQFQNQAQAQQFGQGLQQGQFGNTAQAQALQQALTQRELPLNEISALMSGSQIQNPQFQQYTGQPVQGGNILQAAQAQGQYGQGIYGSQVGAVNSQNAAAQSAATSALMMALMA